MSIKKGDSQLADKNDNPLIGQAQAAVVDAASGASNAQLATKINEVLDVLRAHGLIKV